MVAKNLLSGFTFFFLIISAAVQAVHAHGRQCSELLVSGKNPVPDSAITASSTWAVNVDTKHIPQRSRIDLGLDAVGNGGWSANFNDDKQWLQFDLGFSRKITGVITKGRQGYGTDQSRWQYVTAYRLQYGNATDDMSVYSDHDHEPEVFDGNWNPVTPQVQLLDPPINARYIRINPVKWHNHVSMRADLLGCPLTDTNKATIIG
ncbi:lactadherin-like [Lingula anatina]|uniref:Lactadherin-like n=1 Tax=Lingula anatina TaxID=7574 RepID=A0A1S3JKH6_LINAN|nr:lactadherin-like [Lingula anatina]|eukprot:XP_013410409.1 lactadherin-like [Lingula anatina]